MNWHCIFVNSIPQEGSSTFRLKPGRKESDFCDAINKLCSGQLSPRSRTLKPIAWNFKSPSHDGHLQSYKHLQTPCHPSTEDVSFVNCDYLTGDEATRCDNSSSQPVGWKTRARRRPQFRSPNKRARTHALTRCAATGRRKSCGVNLRVMPSSCRRPAGAPAEKEKRKCAITAFPFRAATGSIGSPTADSCTDGEMFVNVTDVQRTPTTLLPSAHITVSTLTSTATDPTSDCRNSNKPSP